MKQTLATFLMVCFAGIFGFSQSLSLSYNQQKLPVNGTLVRTGSSDSLEMTSWLKIVNESGKLIHVHEKKVELVLANGAAGSICWAGFCYNPSIYESLHPLALDAGEEKVGCFAHFTPGGTIGESLVRWVFYDRDNPSDSVSVTINYITYPTAINEVDSGAGYLSAPFPNPADKEVSFHYSLPTGSDAELVIRSLGGKLMKKERVSFTRNVVRLNTSSFVNGVYYCTLMVEGKATATRRLVVSR
jgi:hypothetical protein